MPIAMAPVATVADLVGRRRVWAAMAATYAVLMVLAAPDGGTGAGTGSTDGAFSESFGFLATFAVAAGVLAGGG